jgi:putative glycosyltransferase
MDLSIVTTLYRSAPELRQFYARMRAEAERSGGEFELIFVNDGSPDDSLPIALEIAHADDRVTVVDLSRNFGHHKAMMTGLARATGLRVFLLDCDLEEAPELLGSFRARMDATGADVVYGVQERRKGSAFERWSGELFFRLFNRLSETPLPANLTTVRLMSRRYVQALVSHRERAMIIGGLWAITGFEQVALPIEKGSRQGGNYDFARKVGVLVNAITSFSDRPLLFIFYMGLVILAASSAAAFYLVVRRLLFGVLLAGWPSLIVSVWLLGGLTLFSIGVIGIYLQKIFLETKQRPYTIVRAVHGRGAEDPHE